MEDVVDAIYECIVQVAEQIGTPKETESLKRPPPSEVGKEVSAIVEKYSSDKLTVCSRGKGTLLENTFTVYLRSCGVFTAKDIVVDVNVNGVTVLQKKFVSPPHHDYDIFVHDHVLGERNEILDADMVSFIGMVIAKSLISRFNVLVSSNYKEFWFAYNGKTLESSKDE